MTTPTPAAAGTPPGLDLPALSRWFAGHVPDCQVPPAATVLHGGRSNLTYRVTDGRSSWVVRRPPLGGLTPSAHDVGREFRVMSALHGSAVAVPQPLAHCTDPEVTGAPFTVVSHVEGRVLRSRADTAGLTPYALRRRADGLVEQLALLHAVPYPEVGLTGWGRPEGYLRRQLDRRRAQWELAATRPLPELLLLHEALDRALDQAVDKAPGTAGRHGSGAAIVHGDFRVDNTILDPADIGRVRAVVDWELSTLGDPLADLGTFLAYRDPAVDALLGTPAATAPGFPGPDELAEQYALFSGRDLSALPFYRALAHFKIAVIAEGVHARHLKGVTVGDGFAGAGVSVPALVRAGRAALGRGR